MQRCLLRKVLPQLFYFYADSNVVIKRGDDSLIYGRAGVQHYYSKPAYKTAIIIWHPDFVDVSSSGDLAYTYGKYQYQNIDAAGKKVSASGIFHTVWKKQSNGSWRFVWD